MTNNISKIYESCYGRWFTRTDSKVLGTKKYRVSTNFVTIRGTHKIDSTTLLKRNRTSIFFGKNGTNEKSITTIKRLIEANSQVIINVIFLGSNLVKMNYNYNVNTTSIKYEEYLHVVSENLMVSLGILKDSFNNQYYGVTITSYIRMPS